MLRLAGRCSLAGSGGRAAMAGDVDEWPWPAGQRMAVLVV